MTRACRYLCEACKRPVTSHRDGPRRPHAHDSYRREEEGLDAPVQDLPPHGLPPGFRLPGGPISESPLVTTLDLGYGGVSWGHASLNAISDREFVPSMRDEEED